MAEKLCTLRKYGGGALKETVLWTNASPTSNFAAQSVLLSDNISKYKFISVKVQFASSANFDTLYSYYDVNELSSRTYNNTVVMPSFGVWRSDARHTRCMYYVDDTHLGFYDNQRIAGSSVSTANNALIPVEISGWK